MPDLQEVFRVATQKVRPDPGALDRQLKGQLKMMLRRRMGAYVLVAVLVGVGVIVAIASIPSQPKHTTGGEGPSPSVQTGTAPDTDFTLDLTSGRLEALPKAITDVANEIGGFAVSPVGDVIAFNGTDGQGTTQVFVANLDGSGIQQLTHRRDGAIFPTWSPDGSRIAYSAPESGDQNVFLIRSSGGKTTQVTHETCCFLGTYQISPDGSSLIYTMDRGDGNGGRVRIISLAGGKSRLLVAPEAGDAGDGTLSPDGRYVSYGGSEVVGGAANRWIADADGSHARLLVEGNFPSATWSPDSTRLAYWSFPEHQVYVIDIASGESTNVAEGAWPIWLDDHTLIVEPVSGL